MTTEVPSDLTWTKSSRSNTNGCVELATLPTGERAVRDSKQRGAGPMLTFNPGEWAAFMAGVKAGEFDLD